jgi:hypothetical protein
MKTTQLRLSGVLILALSVALGCKKDDSDNTPAPQNLTARLVGEWTMTELFYNTSIPNPAMPGTVIPVQGQAQNVSGDFSVSGNPQEVDYTLAFDVTLPPPLTLAIPISIARAGTWIVTSNDTRVIVEDAVSGELIIYDVLENEANRQVWSSEVPFEIPGTGITLTSEIEFTLIRQ